MSPYCFGYSKSVLLVLFSLVCLSSLPLSPAEPSPSPAPAPFPFPSLLHDVSHFIYFPGTPVTPRWHKSTLTYAFSPDHGIDYLDPAEVRAAFARSFARWSACIPVTFTETEDYENADVKIGWYSGDHGDGAPFDGVLGELAHASEPEDGQIHLDAAERWATDLRKERSKVAVDLESVAMHEIGHVLGLGHSTDRDAVMYFHQGRRTRNVELAEDDVVGIQTLYGVVPFKDYVSSGTVDLEGRKGLMMRWSATVKVREGGRDWGWGVVVNVVKKTPAASNSLSAVFASHVVIVTLWISFFTAPLAQVKTVLNQNLALLILEKKLQRKYGRLRGLRNLSNLSVGEDHKIMTRKNPVEGAIAVAYGVKHFKERTSKTKKAVADEVSKLPLAMMTK
ncbi:matrix metalloproteinase [Striga asiatica]|uniref:Matrix metalloproteinase n=1 Tax=Striga asiatica TaxID=4170 RepID=A0A5A7Q657_STRAF|nr:matrix metalloproteinase [Striga asiatica]